MEHAVLNKLHYLLLIGIIVSGCSTDSSDDETGSNGNAIVVKKCDPEENMCLSETEVLHCVGADRVREYCPANSLCYGGVCAPVSCTPYEIQSCLESGKYHGCNPVGTGYGDFDCPMDQTCVDNQCTARLCKAGDGRCLDEETILLCNEAGTSYSVKKKCQDIADKTVCDNNSCVPICEKSTKDASYIGCEYWAVDLDNAIDAGVYDAAGQAFAVVVSNTHATLTANVDVYYRTDSQTRKMLSFDIPPDGLRTVYLPDKCYDGGGSCARAKYVNGTNISDSAYYIKSDLPITAAQFNPLENVQVFSNDASLLFPTTALGRRYMALGRKQHYDVFSAFVTIVAVEPGQTKVEFKANCKFQPGKDKNSQPIPGMQKGDIQTFYLDQFDVLNLETAVFGEDPTGSTVTADKNVAVFVGNEATSLPETDPVTCCADHIEHQQYPLGAWGKEYNAVKLKPRGKERDLWRILARTNDTVVTTTPAVTGAESVTLNAGQWFDILTTESFTIHATSPVLVGQFMAGQNDPNDPETGTFTKDSANIGDPAYLIGVPVEQYRTSYKFLTPGKYAEDYITIVAPLDATVKLDGDIISPAEFFTFGENKYKAAYRMVEDGPHSLEASAPVGLFSYGFDHYVSYGYPAGLDLKELFE